jgi:DNA polymerase III alpha subunit
MAEFVHLHLHTEYSLLDGACRVGELLAEAERLKMTSLAVTEHGNLFSAIVFHDKARQKGISYGELVERIIAEALNDATAAAEALEPARSG